MKAQLISSIVLPLAAGVLLSSCAGPSPEVTAPSTEGTSQSSGISQFLKPKTAVIPAGTVLNVRTDTALSTESNGNGDRFEGTLSAPVTMDGKTLLPAGTSVEGVVASSDKGGRVKGVASMALRLSAVHKGSKSIGVETNTVSFSARATKGRDAATIGIGSGIGAAIGAIAGGGKGAAIGAAAGGGAGTGVVLGTHGEQLRLAPETRLRFTTKAPIEVPVG